MAGRHAVGDVTETDPPVRLGDELEFDPLYVAMATAMASQDVVKLVKGIGHSACRPGS